MSNVKFIFWVILIVFWTDVAFSQGCGISPGEMGYPRQIYEYQLFNTGIGYFSIDQANKLYLSSFRLGMRYLNDSVDSDLIYYSINITVPFAFSTFTHEEAHRSILTKRGISAKNGYPSGTVIGVTNETLKKLRDNDLPTYIYLHTAGIDSDLLIANEVTDQMFFRNEPAQIAMSQYIYSRLTAFTYHNFVSDSFDKEKKPEKKRDIVGHDFYGAIRHLHRPDMEFHRYTNHQDLTPAEQNFLDSRVRKKTFLNLMSGFYFQPFYRAGDIKWNLDFDYNMTPFGDEERAYIYLKRELDLRLDLIFGHNSSHSFPAFNLHLERYLAFSDLFLSTDFSLWQQPKNLEFNTNERFIGGSARIQPEYAVHDWLRFNIGMLYKTKGYERGVSTLHEDAQAFLGTALYF